MSPSSNSEGRVDMDLSWPQVMSLSLPYPRLKANVTVPTVPETVSHEEHPALLSIIMVFYNPYRDPYNGLLWKSGFILVG